MKREIAVLTAFVGIFLVGPHHIRASQQEQSKVTIVPGVGMGDYTLDMNKDDVLRRLGNPKNIHFGGEDYTLDNHPKQYFMFYDDISFYIDEEAVIGISTHSPRYKFANGLKVGDSQDRIIQAFGRNFQLKELKTINCLTYENKGLYFEIDKENGKIEEISVSRISSHGHEGSSIEPFDDVRAKDLSKFDLSSRKGLITKLQYNRETIWPEPAKMPPGSDPEKILTEAMNPGLGVRELHQQGITGKDINVAIIDQPLFKDHPEYDGKIVAYYDTGCNGSESSMHGPAVASLLVGTKCGTAPDARVYYAAAPSWKADSAYYAKGLEWIIAQNEKLPEADKIRIVSVSAAPSGPGSPFKENREMWDQACARAEADGIMVLDCTNSPRGFISRGWYDPDDPESVPKCNYGPPPKREYRVDPSERSLYVPSSCRTTAQHYDYHGRNSYIYWGRGGLSWAIPYCAGVLAMGWQIRPDLTPAQMKELLFASAHVHESGARIIHPKAFIDLVRKQEGNQKVQSSGMISFPKIDRKPKPEMAEPRKMKPLPKYDPDSDNPFQIDLRCRDLSKLDLSNSIDELLYATFDDRTVWPESDKMPSDFTWQKFMEQGKNPGLGVRRLHEKGITGRGVRVAILDQPLLVDHQEYAERVRLYEEIDLQGRTNPAMHGAAVASIAVGETVGVAPDAELYYIAKYNFDHKGNVTMRYIAQGINRILELNEQLPKDNKIRVISISRGWGPSSNGYDDVTAACEKAKAAGVFVVSCSLERVYSFNFHGLGRHPSADPDLFESYEPGLWWAKGFYENARLRDSDRLLVPMDSRTTASPAGSNEYVFYRQGGWSWSVPYIAGVYALAAQVEPDITPERFWNLALKTGRTIELEYKGERRPLGSIIDPVTLINTLQKK